MDNESGYEAGSEASERSQSSSDTSLSYCKKKPCEICGSDANDHMIMTCCACRETREHTYCAKALLHAVPFMWLCEECRSLSRVVTVNSRPNHVDNEASIEHARSRSNRVDNQGTTSDDSCDEISATNQPLQSQAHTSPLVEEASSPVSMDTSPVKNQKLLDSDQTSDSESAK